jgi:hypothetical protein
MAVQEYDLKVQSGLRLLGTKSSGGFLCEL